LAQARQPGFSGDPGRPQFAAELPTSQPGIGNGEADPNSEPGRKGQPTAYDRGLRVLSKDSLSEKAVRRLFRGEYLDFAERLHAANGLNVLAHHYKFTNAR